MRRQLVVLVALATVVLGFAPTAGGDPVPAVPTASDTVSFHGQIPDVAAIAAAVDKRRPYMYVTTLHGIDTYDISDPTLPTPVGSLPLPHFENEAIAMGQRVGADGAVQQTFVLIGFDAVGASPDGQTSTFNELAVVDVTDPASPTLIGRTETATGTHTMSCANAQCTYAYTSGGGGFSVIDLSDPANPKDVKQVSSPVNGGHDWDIDDAGYMWRVGGGGIAAYDTSDPANPELVNGSTLQGTQSPYNDFIMHNSYRPHANQFENRRGPDGDGVREPDEVLPPSAERSAADIRPGETVLITEEDYDSPRCTAQGAAEEGAFQTWHVQTLDGSGVSQAPTHVGNMVPLDTWNTELLNTGQRTPAGAFCSAHYFDYHQDGYVAQGWYQQGMRILDVSDPTDIKQVGFWVAEAQEVWIAYWLPERNADGTAKRNADGSVKKSNVIYSIDAVRGIDILEFSPPAEGTDLTAPILDEWIDPSAEQAADLRARAPQDESYAGCWLYPGQTAHGHAHGAPATGHSHHTGQVGTSGGALADLAATGRR